MLCFVRLLHETVQYQQQFYRNFRAIFPKTVSNFLKLLLCIVLHSCTCTMYWLSVSGVPVNRLTSAPNIVVLPSFWDVPTLVLGRSAPILYRHHKERFSLTERNLSWNTQEWQCAIGWIAKVVGWIGNSSGVNVERTPASSSRSHL